MIEGAQSDFEVFTLNVDFASPNNSEVVFSKELGDQQSVLLDISVNSDDVSTVLRTGQKWLRQFISDLPELISQVDRFRPNQKQRIWIKTTESNALLHTTTITLAYMIDNCTTISVIVPIAFTLSATFEELKDQCMTMLTELVEQSATYTNQPDDLLE